MNNKPNHFLRLVEKYPVAFILALVLALGAMVATAYFQGKQIALERIEHDLDERVNTHKYYLLDALGKYALVPELIASSPLVRQLLVQPTPQHVEAMNNSLNEIAHSTQADRIFIVDRAGTALAANHGKGLQPIVGNNYSLRPYFKQSVGGETGRFIGIGMSSGALGVFISRPVLIDAKVVGVVVVRVSLTLEVFRSVLKQYWEENGEVALIADEHGVVFMSPIDQWMYHTVAPLPPSVRADIEASHQYADQPLPLLTMTPGNALNDQIRFVRFADIPNHVFLQKSYSIGEIGDRLYLHVNASKYWEPVISNTLIAAILALATLLIAITGFQRWSYRAKLVEAAIHDPLTGLYTRLYMNEWIQTALRAHMRDEGAGFALVIFDLDNFKTINDTYGHMAGDAVLREIGKIISTSVRAEDLAVRYGGEELAVFVRFTEPQEVLALAERIRTKLEESSVRTSAGPIAVTASAGIAYHIPGETINALFARADEKLYEAKDQGRNRICS